MSNTEELEDYFPKNLDDVYEMLTDLSNSQTEILLKLDVNSDADGNRATEFKGTQLEILNELKKFTQSFPLTLSNEEKEPESSQLSFNVPLLISTILIIAILAIGIYSLSCLNNLNTAWENKVREKMQEAASLEQVLDLFEKQKEGYHAGQPD